MKIIGAIDIGSNAIRMICARLTPDRRIELVESVRTPLRLGLDVFKFGYLQESTINNLVESIEIFQRTLSQNKCEQIRAYGTSALREADNADEVISKIERITGIQVEAISGGKEAELLQRAVNQVVPLQSGSFLMADLGGGSVEITLVENGEIQFAESFRMGTVRLLQMFPYTPEREQEFRTWAKSYIRDFIATLASRLNFQQIDSLILTGGNANAMTSLYEKSKLTGGTISQGAFFLNSNCLQSLKKMLKNSNFEERIEQFGMSSDRADVIIPASLMFSALLKFSRSKTVVFPMVGLRDGILNEMLEENLGNPAGGEYEQIIHSAFYNARRYSANIRHAKVVHQLAVQIYDGIKELHGLFQRERLLLEVAAILHDIGRFIRPSSHHKHSQYLIQNIELVGLTNSELKLISLIARYHAGSAPSENHTDFQKLSPKNKTIVRNLAAILRVADALDREHKERVHSVMVRLESSRVLLIPSGDHDQLLANWAVNNKKSLFEEQFQRQLELQKNFSPEDIPLRVN
ncbi:MAG: HD domain-containing protein [bacterium]